MSRKGTAGLLRTKKAYAKCRTIPVPGGPPGKLSNSSSLGRRQPVASIKRRSLLCIKPIRSAFRRPGRISRRTAWIRCRVCGMSPVSGRCSLGYSAVLVLRGGC